MVHRVMRGAGVVAACALLASSTTGCKKIARLIGEKAAEQMQETTSSDSTEDGPGATDESMALGQYAEGFNTLIDDPKECLTEYFDDVPLEGPQEGKRYRFFPAHTRGTIEVAEAKKAFEAAQSSAPEQLASLAPLAKAAVADLEKACAVFAEVHKYYDAEDYQDDGGKQGQELHAQMVAAAGSAEKTLQAFEESLSEIEDRHTKSEIAALETDKSYGYWFRHYNFEAKKLLAASDPEDFQAKFLSVETSHVGLTSFSEAKGDAVHAAFKSYLGQADRYHSTAKKLNRALGGGEAQQREVARLQNQLTSSYNSLVSVGNSLRDLEGHGLLK